MPFEFVGFRLKKLFPERYRSCRNLFEKWFVTKRIQM